MLEIFTTIYARESAHIYKIFISVFIAIVQKLYLISLTVENSTGINYNNKKKNKEEMR